MSVFGRTYGTNISGEIFLHGKPADTATVGKAVANGLAYATEDRKVYGLNLIDHIKHNVTIANLQGVSKSGVIDDMGELKVANEYRRKTNIRSSSVYQVTGNLSGGNQQKVVLSKWLFSNPEVLILDEPTRGIDVGAKYEIYTIINKLADEGKGILVISSEMPELLGICDRIYVLERRPHRRRTGRPRSEPGKDHAGDRPRGGEGGIMSTEATAVVPMPLRPRRRMR